MATSKDMGLIERVRWPIYSTHWEMPESALILYLNELNYRLMVIEEKLNAPSTPLADVGHPLV